MHRDDGEIHYIEDVLEAHGYLWNCSNPEFYQQAVDPDAVVDR
jgi:hypothetical protein